MAPGCGAIAAAIEAATGVSPEVVGKPQPTLFIEAIRKLGSSASDTLMIGDNLNIDVLGAHRAGLSTLLVLSGVSTLSDLAFAPVAPDHIYPHLGSACADLQASGALRHELNNT
jgi:ribonucleotide monophosphatase NagD (HAD superfamily)